MIIGSGFNKKNQRFLQEVAALSGKDIEQKILVKKINEMLALDRTEIKNMLEYLDDLGYLKIRTIGGSLLYGHITITRKGLDKAAEDDD